MNDEAKEQGGPVPLVVIYADGTVAPGPGATIGAVLDALQAAYDSIRRLELRPKY